MSKQVENAVRTMNRLTPEKLERLYDSLNQSERKGTEYLLALGMISPGLFIGLSEDTLSYHPKNGKPTLPGSALENVGKGAYAQRFLIHKYDLAMKGHLYTRSIEERKRILATYPSLMSCMDARSSGGPRMTSEEDREIKDIAEAAAAAKAASANAEFEGLPLIQVERFESADKGVLWRTSDGTIYVRTPQALQYILGSDKTLAEHGVFPTAKMAWRDGEDKLYCPSELGAAHARLAAARTRKDNTRIDAARARQIVTESKRDNAYTARIRALIYSSLPESRVTIFPQPYRTDVGPASEQELACLVLQL